MCQVCAALRPQDKSCALEGLSGSGIDTLRATLREGGDAPTGGWTPYRIAPGNGFMGVIGQPGDQDWVGIRLEAGQTYRFDLVGDSLSDPLLRLYDPQGGLLAMNDDAGGGLDSLLTFTATRDGVYFLSAGAYASGTGSYQLTAEVVRPPAMAPMAQLADYLVRGYWGDRGQPQRRFDTGADGVISVDLSGLDPAGRRLARDAMQAWEAVADLHFVERRGNADITFSDDRDGAFAQSTLLGGRLLRSEVNVDRGWLDLDGVQIGTYSFQVYVHEIGHALGLGHQGNYNGSGSFDGDARFLNDSWQASVMSYFGQDENPYIPADRAYLGTLMPADILAIQRLYGAAGAGSLTAGDTTYGVGHSLGDSWLGRIFSAQAGAAQGTVRDARQIAVTIHDAGGFDLLDFSNDRVAQRVDLRAGMASDIYGMRGTLQIGPGTVIEAYAAGSSHDRVTGNAAANILRGHAGNDRLDGMAGDDRLFGGSGNDVLGGGWGNDRLWGEAGDDRLTDMLGDNLLSGGAGNDRLVAGAGRDTLRGDAGHDVMLAGGGDDLLLGGAGNDLLRGDRGDDRLEGGSGADRLHGQQGDDILVGGAGADIMAGGLGADVFVFTRPSDSARGAADRITDFTPGQDRLDLSALDLDLIGRAPLTGGREIRFEHRGTETHLLIDVTGDRVPDMVIRMAGRHILDADDFIL